MVRSFAPYDHWRLHHFTSALYSLPSLAVNTRVICCTVRQYNLTHIAADNLDHSAFRTHILPPRRTVLIFHGLSILLVTEACPAWYPVQPPTGRRRGIKSASVSSRSRLLAVVVRYKPGNHHFVLYSNVSVVIPRRSRFVENKSGTGQLGREVDERHEGISESVRWTITLRLDESK